MPTLEHLPDIPLSTYDPEAVLAAESIVRDYCGWHIAPKITETVTLDGSGTYRLFLPTLRLRSVTSIVDDGRTLTPADYEWSANGTVERLHSLWTHKRRGVVFTIEHGYDSCPWAVTEMVKQLSKSGPASIHSASIGQTSVTYGTAAPSWDILNKYRIPKRL